MGMRMLVTITIPDTEERTVALVQDLVTLLQKYPGSSDEDGDQAAFKKCGYAFRRWWG